MPVIEGWKCYVPGDLNPHLVGLLSADIMSNPHGATMRYQANGLSLLGTAVSEKISPNVLRKAKKVPIKAVVLGGYKLTGPAAASINMNLKPVSSTEPHNAQMLYVRVPEVHSYVPDPFCEEGAYTKEQIDVLVEMHTEASIPIWTSSSPRIFHGSIVEVKFGKSWKEGEVTKILSEEAERPTMSSLVSSMLSFASGAPILSQDPGNCPWSNGAQAQETEWKSTDYPDWNGTKLRNGLLEETGMLVSDPASGAQLVPPAMDDFLKLAAAYAKKFPGKTLKGSGYRPYATQVDVRVKRFTSSSPCGSKSEHDAAGNFIGFAATPGTSNHGWGAAVDIDRDASGWTNGNEGNSPEFQWINKFSQSYNFVFGVRNEHWHIDWMPFSAQTTGGVSKTAQTPWTNEGRGDSSITLG